MASDTDIAWCAGFFDGEGHVSYHRGYPNSRTMRVSAQLYANVPQASDNIEVLEFFQSIIGFGKIKGPYPTKHKNKHIVHYGVNEVEKLFIILKPYLKEKKASDFRLALGGYLMHDGKVTKEDIERMLKRNRKKGCPKCNNKEWSGLICSKCGYIAY